MKILKNDLNATDIAYCNKCGSTLEIVSSDLFEKDMNLFVTVPAFKCPICGQILIYSGDKLKVEF